MPNKKKIRLMEKTVSYVFYINSMSIKISYRKYGTHKNQTFYKVESKPTKFFEQSVIKGKFKPSRKAALSLLKEFL